MKKFLGFGVIALGIFLEILWLGVCFGTVIVGIALLIFAPRILFFPFNFFLVIGLAMIGNVQFQNRANFRYQSYSGGHQETPNFTQPQSSLSKHYETLESQPTDSMEVIKKNYRRLVKEYHYDSIASKDLPADMLKFAQQKTQELNEAYSAIKEARAI
jgi:hypothetical protein